jgi:hypothetical protein
MVWRITVASGVPYNMRSGQMRRHALVQWEVKPSPK